MTNKTKRQLFDKAKEEMRKCGIDRAFLHQIRSGQWKIRPLNDEVGLSELSRMADALAAIYGRTFYIELHSAEL